MHLGFIKITYNRTAAHFLDDRFVNLVEEVILTLRWHLNQQLQVCCICYWLFKCMCVCVCERERERERDPTSPFSTVIERERGGSHHSGVSCFNHGLCANTHKLHHWVCHVTLFLSRLELMLKPTTLLSVFTLKTDASDYGKGCYIPVFGQSQCTRSAGQSEHTVLVRRRGFVENDAFERGGA